MSKNRGGGKRTRVRRYRWGVVVAVAAILFPTFIIGVRPTGAAASTPALNVVGPTGVAKGSASIKGFEQEPSPNHRVGAVHDNAVGAPIVSSNWSGYVQTGTQFNQVTGQWTVPAIPASTTSAVAQWVGIGGLPGDPDLIQAGTTELAGGSAVEIMAFFEILPNAAQFVPNFPVSPGDQIAANVFEAPPGSGNWTLFIEDLTTQQSAIAATQGSYTPAAGSAEWIVENPTLVDANTGTVLPVPLANFGTTTFSPISSDGTSLSALVESPVEMTDDTGVTVIATPSTLDSNGFAVGFGSTAPPAPGGSNPPPPPTCASTVGTRLGSAVGITAVEVNGCLGYYIVNGAGVVSDFGAARSLGDLRGVTINAPIIAITATPDGGGYWLLAADGGVFSFGDASFHGSTGNLRLNAPVVGMAATLDGGGYWLVAKDGGIFSFGDATFHGSTGNLKLNQPVDGMAVGARGAGYWLVASDGGVFAFSEPFVGSLGATRLNKPIIGMSSNQSGTGYTLVASDGGVFTFNSPFFGSLGANPPASPVVGLAPVPGNTGYYLVDGTGHVYTFGSAQYFGGAS